MSTGSISSTSSKHNDNDDDSVYQDNDEDHRDHQHRLRLRLVELGPGRGTLMADALRQLPLSFLQNMEIHFVEVSPVLRRAQAEALGCVDIVTDSSVEAGDEAYDIGNPNQYHLSHPGRIITRIHTLPFPFTLTLSLTLTLTLNLIRTLPRTLPRILAHRYGSGGLGSAHAIRLTRQACESVCVGRSSGW